MNKKSIAVFLIIFIFTAAAFGFFLRKKAEAPIVSENIPTETGLEKESPYDDLIRVSFPSPGEKIGGTINVTGIARGTWYFEGDFPVHLVDASGKKLISAPAAAEGEWMKEDFVPFAASLKYWVSETTLAKIILEKDNPSDIRELDAAIEIPVVLEPDTTSTKVFFMNRYRDQNASVCDQVFSAGRTAYETMAYAHQTVEELLGGTTQREEALGYSTAIPPGVKIQNFDAFSKVARIDLSKELLFLDVDTACRRLLMQKQIEETIKNSSDAESVVITVDGKPFPGEFPDEGPKME